MMLAVSRAELVPRLAYSLALKMEAIYSSKTSDDYHQTTQQNIPEDTNFHSHHCENLKTSIKINYQKFTKKELHF
jgi:hypothetical protein